MVVLAVAVAKMGVALVRPVLSVMGCVVGLVVVMPLIGVRLLRSVCVCLARMQKRNKSSVQYYHNSSSSTGYLPNI